MEFLIIKGFDWYTEDCIDESLFDDTVRELRVKAKKTPQVISRSKKQIVAYYNGCMKSGQVRFFTPSGTTKGKIWNQSIRFLDIRKVLKKSKGLNRDQVRAMVMSDIAIYCNCPAFLYWGGKYNAWKGGFGIRKEIRSPNIRDPQRDQFGCKHLYQVLSVLPFHISHITRDYKKVGLFK